GGGLGLSTARRRGRGARGRRGRQCEPRPRAGWRQARRAASRGPDRTAVVRRGRGGARSSPVGERSRRPSGHRHDHGAETDGGRCRRDRKSTRLNSSHVAISYAVFCLKKKKYDEKKSQKYRNEPAPAPKA